MKKIGILLLAASLTLTTACSSESKTTGNAEQPPEPTQQSGQAEQPQQDTPNDNKGKLNLENDGVDEAKLSEALKQFPAEKPERIITTSVPLAEMLHLLNITPVGVPTSTNPLPADFESITQIGSPMSPDLEVVTSLQPDLLLGAESLRSTLDKTMEGIKMEKAYLKTDSFDDLKLSFKALGTYFDKKEEMNRVLTTILEKENELSTLAEGKTMPSVLLLIGTSDSFMVMSESSYLGSLVKRLGADNIASSKLNVAETYSPVNMESVVAADPDIILVLASGDHGASKDMFQEEVSKNDAWTKLSAYKNDNIHLLDYSVFGVTSISNVNTALTQIADYFFK